MSPWSEDDGTEEGLRAASALIELNVRRRIAEDQAWVNSSSPSNKSGIGYGNHPEEDSPPSKKKLFF